MKAPRSRASCVEEGDAEESSISLAAMEAELKPEVLAILDEIAALYKKLGKLQDRASAALRRRAAPRRPSAATRS